MKTILEELYQDIENLPCIVPEHLALKELAHDLCTRKIGGDLSEDCVLRIVTMLGQLGTAYFDETGIRVFDECLTILQIKLGCLIISHARKDL